MVDEARDFEQIYREFFPNDGVSLCKLVFDVVKREIQRYKAFHL